VSYLETLFAETVFPLSRVVLSRSGFEHGPWTLNGLIYLRPSGDKMFGRPTLLKSPQTKQAGTRELSEVSKEV
jgi:hypothetical protein